MSSSSDSNSEYIVPNDHVALVLLEDRGSSFYLQVPLTTICASYLKPLKYLLYLGWCILSAEGVLSLERDDRDGIDTDEDAVGGEIYYYVLAAPLGTFLLLSRVHAGHLQHVIYLSTEDLAQVVDPNVIKARTDTPGLNLPQRVMISAPFWRSVMFDVCGQEVCWWTVYTSSPLNGVPKYVPRLFCTEASDRLPSG